MSWSESLENVLETSPEELGELVKVVAQLRHPTDGCPWDLKQDHKSLRRYMLEEAYEAADAMGGDDTKAIVDELGDVLLQVVLNGQLLSDSGRGSLTEIIAGIRKKMVRRHPHVFEDMGDLSEEEIKKNWQRIKAKESVEESKERVFQKVQKERFPSLLQAYKIGKRAEEIAFDWGSPLEVWDQFYSEVKELEHEVRNSGDEEKVLDEIGDVFFSLSQLCRHLKIDPEVAASRGNQKFLNRFKVLEDIAEERGLDVFSLGTSELENLWKDAKKMEKK